MSDKGSVFQKGGGGTNFEQVVQAAFVTTLIIRGNAPSLPSNEIVEVGLQSTNRGYETDDLFAIAKSSLGQHRLLAQIKHNLIISDNDKFNEVISAFWKDFNNTQIFDKAHDKLLIIKSGLTKNERNHVKPLLNWANSHATDSDFFSEVERIKAKNDYLNIFSESVKKANGNRAVKKLKIWNFLKSLDILEYDFLNESSADETYFLNLIRLSKNNKSTSNEKDIWSSIYYYVAGLNKDGGSITAESILKHEIYQHFDNLKLSPYFKSIVKLQSDSNLILKPIKNTIGGLHIPRKNAYQSITDTINEFHITIVTGNPGVGKSAAVKDILESDYVTASIYVFRADQFNTPHLANVFSDQGVNEPIQDIFSCTSLIPQKAIVIDGLEKLLEGDPDNAFKQLLSLISEYPGIKVIATARRYSIDLIYQKFGIDSTKLGVIEIAPFDAKELETVEQEYPQLKNILSNPKIKKLLGCPKYLDFAVTALQRMEEDFTEVSLKDFKESLWNALIKDPTKRSSGLPAKREDAFLDIAVTRASEMKLFVKPKDADAEAVDLLENDDIICQEKSTRHYSPAHDILEDWALVKYVSSKYENHPEPQDLFIALGNAPAIRRAFRLWVEDEIIAASNSLEELVKATIVNLNIEQYWADELLIAIFKSNDCSSFFDMFQKDLLAKEAKLLNRCIHLARTACIEGNLENNKFTFLIPIGSGWQELIAFIRRNISQLDNIRLSIINLLIDWENRLLFEEQIQESEQLDVQGIIIHFLAQIENNDQFWLEQNILKRRARITTLLLRLSKISKSQISSLVKRAIKAKSDRTNFHILPFYKDVINQCLSGLNTQRLAKDLPELIVQTAFNEWKLPIERHLAHNDRAGFPMDTRIQGDECWGIKDRFSFFPSGIYKTPIFNLLNANPLIGLKFVIDFLNYSVEFYMNADCDHKDDIVQVEFELNDGTNVQQWGSWPLWVAYRGLAVTHYAIESVLMSLEKYLLNTAGQQTITSRENLQFIFNYLLRNTNNAAVTSVMVSTSIAYPEEVGKEMLPILKVREFYDWDLTRSIQERAALAPMDDQIPFAQKERWESNQLDHRTRYMRGLIDFVFYHQINISTLNVEIHEIIDGLKSNLSPEDLIWNKTLTELDIRSHKLSEYDDKMGGFKVEPDYDDGVKTLISSNSDKINKDTESARYSNLLNEAFEGSEPITSDNWKNCFKAYTKKKQFDSLYDRPITLAVIGLRDFADVLIETEKKWCTEAIVNAISTILQNAFRGSFSIYPSLNLMEKDIALSSFHYLFNHINNETERKDLIAQMIYMLFAPLGEAEVDNMLDYLRTDFYKFQPEITKLIWSGLIEYSKFRKTNPYFYDDYDNEQIDEIKAKEREFVAQLATGKDLNLEVEGINLSNHEGYLLARAFAFTPFDSSDNVCTAFINRFIHLVIEDLKLDDEYSESRSKRMRKIPHEGRHDAEQFIAELILKANFQVSKQVIDILIDLLPEKDDLSLKNSDVIEFVQKSLEYVVLKIYDHGTTKTDDSLYAQQELNFWNAWNYLAQRIKKLDRKMLVSTVFLNIRYLLYNHNWTANNKPWEAFRNDNGLYNQLVSDFADCSISKYIIEIYSTIGGCFLPEGLSPLVSIIKDNPNELESLTSPSAERMVSRLFYNHISHIKKNSNQINDFIWILNRMVDLGSSQAYLFRENVMIYKPQNY